MRTGEGRRRPLSEILACVVFGDDTRPTTQPHPSAHPQRRALRAPATTDDLFRDVQNCGAFSSSHHRTSSGIPRETDVLVSLQHHELQGCFPVARLRASAKAGSLMQYRVLQGTTVLRSTYQFFQVYTSVCAKQNKAR